MALHPKRFLLLGMGRTGWLSFGIEFVTQGRIFLLRRDFYLRCFCWDQEVALTPTKWVIRKPTSIWPRLSRALCSLMGKHKLSQIQILNPQVGSHPFGKRVAKSYTVSL